MNFLRKLYYKLFWKFQDTKHDCNGDIRFAKGGIIVETHTNSKWTHTTEDSWKENRCEIAKELEGRHKWEFDFFVEEFPDSPEWVILSQLWAKGYHNYLSVVMRNNDDDSFQLSLDKKQDGVTTTLWSRQFPKILRNEIRLKVSRGEVWGTINGFATGRHQVDTPHRHELKIGAYWSGKISFSDKMRIRFSNICKRGV